MKTDYTLLSRAAVQVCAEQHYPTGTLYMVAVPIGNLADITLRAIYVLGLADLVACEDTRHSQNLLRAYGLDGPRRLLALHAHNEQTAADAVLDCLQQGQRVAYISDAGTPGLSDPGARLVQRARSAGLPVMPLPGASSLTTLISASGVLQDDEHAAWLFRGFLPAHGAARQQAIAALGAEPRAQLVLESPHRILALAEALRPLGHRRLTVGRELTKAHEEIVTLESAELGAWLQAQPQRTKGEFILALHGASGDTQSPCDVDNVLRALLVHVPLKSAVNIAVQCTGMPRNALYARALQLQTDSA